MSTTVQLQKAHQFVDGHINTMRLLTKKIQSETNGCPTVSTKQKNALSSRWIVISLFILMGMILGGVVPWLMNVKSLGSRVLFQLSTIVQPTEQLKQTSSNIEHESTQSSLKNPVVSTSPSVDSHQPDNTMESNKSAMLARQQQLELIKQELALIVMDRKINYVDISRSGFLAMTQKRAQRFGYKESVLRAMRQAQLMQAHLTMVTSKQPTVALPSGYTIQLLGTHNQSALLEFIQQHQLNEQTRYFTTLRQGKPWYVLTFGQYPTLQAAQNALSTLPSTLRVAKPWPRSFNSIQVINTDEE